jgi:hypothetical protein
MSISTHIPTGAGSSRLVRENIIVRGRKVRVPLIVFTTHDGFMGEAVMHRGQSAIATREAYEAAVAQRAAALFKAQQASMHALPSYLPQAPKPAPEAQLLNALKDTVLFSEVERRGWAIAPAEEVMA